MIIYTLYVKTHRKTGLKYFGQTKNNPHTYPGSGTDWKTHLQEYGLDIDTEIILQTTNKEERNAWGKYYSNLWSIVTATDNFGNKIWANRIPETGSGGGGKGVFGDKNPMKNPLVVAKKSGQLSSSKRLDVRAKIQTTMLSKGDTHTSKREEFRANMRGDKNPSKRAEVIAKHSGKNHYLYDHTIYRWEHKLNSAVVYMTRANFIKEYKMDPGAISSLIKGTKFTRKGFKGWTVTMSNDFIGIDVI